MADTRTETGLKGEYFPSKDLSGTPVTRIDPTIDFNWGTGSPIAGIAANNFSVRWTGSVQPEHSETYTFFTTSDDGARLWVDDRLLIDNWTAHASTENSATIELAADVQVSIKVEYFEAGGAAVMKLAWSSASRSKQSIPTSRLSPSAPAPVAEPAPEPVPPEPESGPEPDAAAQASSESAEPDAAAQASSESASPSAAQTSSGSAEPSAAQPGSNKILRNGLSLVADTMIVPGASLAIDGQFKAGALHAVVGIVARMAIGPIGWFAVAANSFSKSARGKYLVGSSKDE